MLKKCVVLQSPEHVLRFLLFIILPLVCLYEVKDLSSDSMIFPMVSCLIMLCVGIKQVIFFSKDVEHKEVSNFSVLCVVICALVIFCGLLDIIGFYADIFLLSCFCYLHFEAPINWRKVVFSIVIALIITSCMFVFFRYALLLVMPEGILLEV